jgi:DNA mismatch endonuclease (patch repair protein)
MGLRYRKHVLSLPGKPDIVFVRARVAVFCDGDFWHGRDWRSLRVKLKRRANPDYWIPKIRSNIERDRRNERLLAEDGWLVIRLWETDVLSSPLVAARYVRGVVDQRRRDLCGK